MNLPLARSQEYHVGHLFDVISYAHCTPISCRGRQYTRHTLGVWVSEFWKVTSSFLIYYITFRQLILIDLFLFVHL